MKMSKNKSEMLSTITELDVDINILIASLVLKSIKRREDIDLEDHVKSHREDYL